MLFYGEAGNGKTSIAEILSDLSANGHGVGRELFALFRQHAAVAEQGASPLFAALPHPLP